MTTKLKKTKRKFKGIVKDAKTLRTDRTHLYRVLTGERISKTLLKRYKDLQSKKRKSRKEAK